MALDYNVDDANIESICGLLIELGDLLESKSEQESLINDMSSDDPEDKDLSAMTSKPKAIKIVNTFMGQYYDKVKEDLRKNNNIISPEMNAEITSMVSDIYFE